MSNDELQELKDRATQLGITFKSNIGVEALRAKVNAVLTDKATPAQVNALDETAAVTPEQSAALSALGLSPAVLNLLEMLARGKPLGDGVTPAPTEAKRVMGVNEVSQAERDKQNAEQLKLVRCRITCLNPQKAHVQGEIITVGNRVVGNVRRFVPFGEATDNGWHIPYIIYTELQQRQFQQIGSKKGPNGQQLPQVRLVKEFAIEVLEPLTERELQELARRQAAAQGVAA